MKKSYFYLISSIVCTLMAIVSGNGALMAIAGSSAAPLGNKGDNANGGKTGQGAENPASNYENLDGVASQTENARLGENPETDANSFDSRGLAKTIREIQPMKTPFDTLTRYATSGEKPEGMKIEYASIGSRPTLTYLTEALKIYTGTSSIMKIADPDMVSIDDVLVFPEVCAVTDAEGNAYATKFANNFANPAWPSLMVKVCGYDDSTGYPVVYALNGNQVNGSTDPRPLYTNSIQYRTDLYGTNAATTTGIAANKKVLRIAKAVNEGAAQTGRTAELPKTDTQYLQIFMTQVEESMIHKLTKRDVNGLDLAWHERRAIEDMKMVQEGTFLFSDKTCIKNHPKENLNKVWTTGGVWHMAGKDINLGHLDTNSNLEITEDDLVEMAKDAFVGEGTGGKKKILIGGSNFVEALEKIKSEKFRLKGDVQAWDMTFNSWKTNFGEFLVIHCETMDKYGKSNWAFCLDPEYFEKRVLYSLDRNVLDLEAMGVRATQAVVLKEISAVVLYAPQAHARVKLYNQDAVAF